MQTFFKSIFGDKYRLLLLTITISMLLILGIYSHTVGTAKQDQLLLNLVLCVAGRSECPDKVITLSAQIKQINEQDFVVNIRTKKGARWKDLFERNYDVTVIGSGHKLRVGDTIALQGRFTSNQTFILEKYEVEGAWIREIKYGISLLALGLTGLIWFRTFSFSLRQFIFFRKEDS